MPARSITPLNRSFELSDAGPGPRRAAMRLGAPLETPAPAARRASARAGDAHRRCCITQLRPARAGPRRGPSAPDGRSAASGGGSKWIVVVPLDASRPTIGEADAAFVEPSRRRACRAARGARRGPRTGRRNRRRTAISSGIGSGERTKAPQPDAFVAGVAAQELEAAGIEAVALQPEPSFLVVQVGIGEIDDQRAIVVEHDRAEQQRLATAEPHLEMGEEARIVEIEAVGTAVADRMSPCLSNTPNRSSCLRVRSVRSTSELVASI